MRINQLLFYKAFLGVLIKGFQKITFFSSSGPLFTFLIFLSQCQKSQFTMRDSRTDDERIKNLEIFESIWVLLASWEYFEALFELGPNKVGVASNTLRVFLAGALSGVILYSQQ